jgi:hypothetical protein
LPPDGGGEVDLVCFVVGVLDGVGGVEVGGGGT